MKTIICKMKDIKLNLLISEDRAMQIERQVDLASKNLDNEYQSKQAASNDEAAAVDILAQTDDDLVSPHPPEADWPNSTRDRKIGSSTERAIKIDIPHGRI